VCMCMCMCVCCVCAVCADESARKAEILRFSQRNEGVRVM